MYPKFWIKTPHAPLGEQLIREFHHITTKGIDYPHKRTGAIPYLFPYEPGVYSPPQSGDRVQTLMREFIKWFYSGEPQGWDPVIQSYCRALLRC